MSKAISCGSKGKCFGHAKNVEETANAKYSRHTSAVWIAKSGALFFRPPFWQDDNALFDAVKVILNLSLGINSILFSLMITSSTTRDIFQYFCHLYGNFLMCMIVAEITGVLFKIITN